MKQQFKFLFLLAAMISVAVAKVHAYDAEIDGIYYNFNGDEAEVTYGKISYNSYDGDILIPEKITYDNKTYKVTKIGYSAFNSCINLSSVIIPNSIKIIDQNSFAYCNLQYLSLGNSVEKIDPGAFSNLKAKIVNLTDLESFMKISFGSSPGANPLGHADKVFLNDKEIKELIIPSTVTEIKEYTFYNCNFLSVVIPNSVTKIGLGAFQRDTIQSLTIGSGVLDLYGAFYESSYISKTIWLTNTPPAGYNQVEGKMNYVSNEKYRFGSKTKTCIYPLLSSMFSVNGIKYVPTSLADRTCEAIDAVYNESSTLTKIGLSVTYKGLTMEVNYVQPYTCCGNTFIKNVELTDLPFIENYVFEGCTNLLCVKLPKTIGWLGVSSFQCCSSISDISIPAATTELKHNLFKGCTALKNMTIEDGNSVLNIAYNNDAIKIDKNGKVNTYGEGAPIFEDCPLDSVYIGRKIKYDTRKVTGYSPFYRNTSLRSVRITDAETEISENEFYGCTGLKNVWIGNGVTTIGNWAFSDCSSLDYFEFGSAMKNISTEAFSDCANVTKIISHAAIPPVCGSQALDDINKWTCTLYVPDGHIGAYQVADQWKEFLFTDNLSTGVKDVTVRPNGVAPIHSLSGQRLKTPRKGINIIDGQKVIIK